MGKLWAALILVFFCSISHQVCYYVLLHLIKLISTIILNVFLHILIYMYFQYVSKYCKCLYDFYWFAMFVFQQNLPRVVCRCTIYKKLRFASSPNV